MDATRDTPEQDDSRFTCDFILVKGLSFARRRDAKKLLEKKKLSIKKGFGVNLENPSS